MESRVRLQLADEANSEFNSSDHYWRERTYLGDLLEKFDNDVSLDTSSKLNIMTNTTEVSILMPVWTTLTSFKITIVWKSKNITYVIAYFPIDKGEIEDAHAIFCWFAEAHTQFCMSHIQGRKTI